MTKQEIIKQAYGEHWELVKNSISENGWVKAELLYHLYSKNGLHKDFEQSGADRSKGFGPPVFYVRPKSLQGIEDNNGWIKIEDKEKMKSNNTIDIVYTDKGNIYSYATFRNFASIHEQEKVTHFKQLEKPKPPIY